MNRRHFLLSTSGAIFTTTVAGCSSDGGSDSDNTQQHLQEAGNALKNAEDAISEEGDKFEDTNFEDGGVEVNPVPVQEYLDTAAEELDAAESGANENQQKEIDAARSWIAFARAAIDLLDVLADGYTEVSTGLTYFQSERYQDAANRLETASGTLSEANQKLTLLRDRADGLDSTSGENIEEVDLTSLDADIETLADIVESLIPMSDGLRQISLGMVDFETGTSELDNREYTEAEASYKSARDHFSSAETTFTDLEGSAPNTIQDRVIELTCYSGALKEGADHFATAANALESGDTETANKEAEKGEEALNQCGFD